MQAGRPNATPDVTDGSQPRDRGLTLGESIAAGGEPAVEPGAGIRGYQGGFAVAVRGLVAQSTSEEVLLALGVRRCSTGNGCQRDRRCPPWKSRLGRRIP